MKIAIPSEGKTLESNVHHSFGRAEFFIVTDSNTLQFDVIDNQAVSVQGGAGIKAAQTVADSGAEVLITFRCGENAADVLRAAGIKILQAVSGTVAEMVANCEGGKLLELADIHPGYHNHGGA